MCGLFSPKEKKGEGVGTVSEPEPIVSKEQREENQKVEKEVGRRWHIRIPFMEIIFGIVTLAVFFNVWDWIQKSGVLSSVNSSTNFDIMPFVGLVPIIVVVAVIAVIIQLVTGISGVRFWRRR